MNDKKTNYWGFRTHWRNSEAHKFLCKEVKEGRLRQGWGWLEGQKLPECKEDCGAKRNLPIYNKVKKGDYLLIPHVPSYNMVTIVRAKEDFSTGYKYEIAEQKATEKNKGFKDYGHIFPIETEGQVEFIRMGEVVEGDVRASLRNPKRFWNMSKCYNSIINILDATPEQRTTAIYSEQRVIDLFNTAIEQTIDDEILKKCIRDLFERYFHAAEWEYALRKTLELIAPHCVVKRIGGITESKHGCDLAILIPSVENKRQYVIGIQVKDYKDIVTNINGIIKQINKANDFWKEEDSFKLIDKYLIIIDSSAENNPELETEAKKNGIRVLYKDDVLDLLTRAAKIQMAKNLLTL